LRRPEIDREAVLSEEDIFGSTGLLSEPIVITDRHAGMEKELLSPFFLMKGFVEKCA